MTTLPDIAVSPAADTAVGTADAQTAWETLGEWILRTGFRPDLILSIAPTADSLAVVTDQMTTACSAIVQSYASDPNKMNTDNLETLTAIGVRAPAGTLVAGDDAVSNRVVTDATADLDEAGALAVTVTSSADIHYVDDADSSRRFHSTFKRTTTYTLVKQIGRWLVADWRGTYTTTDPITDR